MEIIKFTQFNFKDDFVKKLHQHEGVENYRVVGRGLAEALWGGVSRLGVLLNFVALLHAQPFVPREQEHQCDDNLVSRLA